MAENTEIAWTHHTFNPVKGCQKVSEGCKHCYAESETKRYGLAVWGPTAPRIRTAPENWKGPRKWNKRAALAGVRERVFCASWADVGEDHPDWVQPRRDLARLIEETPALDWLLLTKRPESLVRLFADAGWSGAWPANVWAGTTVENQGAADERIPHLLRVPARVHFLSCEPLLGPLDLRRHLEGGAVCECDHKTFRCNNNWIRCNAGLRRPRWVIVGGESGYGSRPFDLAWARSIRDQCKAAGTAFFFKQAGAKPLLDGAPLVLRDRKGGDLAEIPEDLRIREWP